MHVLVSEAGHRYGDGYAYGDGDGESVDRATVAGYQPS